MSDSLSCSRFKSYGKGGKITMKIYALFEVKGDDYDKGEIDTNRIFLNENDAVKELYNVTGCWYVQELEVKL